MYTYYANQSLLKINIILNDNLYDNISLNQQWTTKLTACIVISLNYDSYITNRPWDIYCFAPPPPRENSTDYDLHKSQCPTSFFKHVSPLTIFTYASNIC